MKIVALQNLDGSWSDVEAVVLLSGKSPNEFDTLRSALGAAFATVLAVAILRQKCAARQSAWSLVVQKALTWLENELGNAASAELQITRVIAIL
jgi:hypothetical protein